MISYNKTSILEQTNKGQKALLWAFFILVILSSVQKTDSDQYSYIPSAYIYESSNKAELLKYQNVFFDLFS